MCLQNKYGSDSGTDQWLNNCREYSFRLPVIFSLSFLHLLLSLINVRWDLSILLFVEVFWHEARAFQKMGSTSWVIYILWQGLFGDCSDIGDGVSCDEVLGGFVCHLWLVFD